RRCRVVHQVMSVRLSKGEESAQSSIPPGEDGPPMESPSEPGTNLCKGPFPYHRLALKSVCRGGTGWSQNLSSQYCQQQLWSICESGRHDIRLTEPAMAIVFEIPVECTENVSPLELAAKLSCDPSLCAEPRNRSGVATSHVC